MPTFKAENAYDEFQNGVQKDTKICLGWKQWLKISFLTLAVSLLTAGLVFTVTYFIVFAQLQQNLVELNTQLAEMEDKNEMRLQEVEKRNNLTFSRLQNQNNVNSELPKLQQKIDSLDTKLAVLQKQINCNTKLRCEDGWELYNKHCYKFVKEKETRGNAQAKCNDECAALVKIDDALENSFIYSSGGLPNTYVPGEGHKEVYWTSGIRNGRTNWMWSVDGTSFTYDNFGSAEPNNQNGRENCINITNDGKWNDMWCNENAYDDIQNGVQKDTNISLGWKQWLKTIFLTLAVSLLTAGLLFTVTYFSLFAQLQQKLDSLDTKLAVLHKQINSNTKLLIKDNVSCEHGWKMYKNHCYKFVKDERTHTMAQVICSQERASLVKIDDADENSFIYSAGGSKEVYWTSGIRISKNNWVWTADGTHVIYDNFHSNEPNNQYGIEDCINVRKDGTWNDYKCNRTIYYICEKRA
ncbi:unnamed protein product [Mytilus coruscus]|uniref:C-type lectin domain-containing protein n=1 Tax=Mytilus coruscus TaxID=42192 RepID=A0A6J8A519_MYTCO|nr:unnamed protein product [Mytilus coruscus]